MKTRRNDHKRWSHLLIPALILIAGLGATYYASLYNAARDKEQFETRFQAQANQTTLLIQEKLNRYPLILRSTRGLVLSQLDNLSREWPRYFEQANIDFEDNGIIGITYTQYVSPQDRSFFEEQQRALYGDSFRIFPETAHNDAFPLMQAAPAAITSKVRGYDIGSEPNRRYAAERAKNTSSLALSAPISLLPTAQSSLDYLFLLPVESADPFDPYTPVFHGWITIGFSLSQLLEETLKKLDSDIRVRAIDARIGQTPGFDSHPDEKASAQTDAFALRQTLTLSRQKIDLIYTPLHTYVAENTVYTYDPLTLAGGGVISLLSTLACFLLIGGRANALRQADVMSRRSKDSNTRYQALFESSPEAILLCVDNKIILGNSTAVSMLGASRIEDLIGLDVLKLAIENEREAANALMQSLIAGTEHKLPPLEEVLLRLDGTSFDVEMSLSRTTYDGSTAIQLMFRDITDVKERRNNAKVAKKVLEHTTEAIMVTDSDARIILTNPAFTTLTGYNEKQVVGQRASLLKSGHHDQLFYQQLWRALLHTGQWIGEIANRKRSGEVYIQKTNISAVYDRDGNISHFVCVMSDITEQKRTFDTIRFQALHDNLTKLPNRVHFEARAEKALIRARNNKGCFAILFIDLDDFKPINDTYGHLLGDKLLVALSDKLSAALRPSDMVARIGGDEFLVLTDNLPFEEEATLLAERLMRIICSPVSIDGTQLSVSASIGISVYPNQGADINTLIHIADQAMYGAKNSGKNQIFVAGEALTTETD